MTVQPVEQRNGVVIAFFADSKERRQRYQFESKEVLSKFVRDDFFDDSFEVGSVIKLPDGKRLDVNHRTGTFPFENLGQSVFEVCCHDCERIAGWDVKPTAKPLCEECAIEAFRESFNR